MPATITSPSAPSKQGWGFGFVSGTGETLYCDVAFPRSANTNAVNVNLTWQQGVTGVGACWQARWEITRPGQRWGANDALAAPANHVATSVATAHADVRSVVPIVATDQSATPCATGTSPTTCAGSHGLLAITRLAQEDCPGTQSTVAILTRIELTGATP